MTTDTKAKIAGAVTTVGTAAIGAATMGWKAALLAGAGAALSFFSGLFHVKPGK